MHAQLKGGKMGGWLPEVKRGTIIRVNLNYYKILPQ
jgi:hypothetical protein